MRRGTLAVAFTAVPLPLFAPLLGLSSEFETRWMEQPELQLLSLTRHRLPLRKGVPRQGGVHRRRPPRRSQPQVQQCVIHTTSVYVRLNHATNPAWVWDQPYELQPFGTEARFMRHRLGFWVATSYIGDMSRIICCEA